MKLNEKKLAKNLALFCEVASENDVTPGAVLFKRLSCWRDVNCRQWILDKARSQGFDFEVYGFSCASKPMIRVFKIDRTKADD